MARIRDYGMKKALAVQGLRVAVYNMENLYKSEQRLARIPCIPRPVPMQQLSSHYESATIPSFQESRR